MSIVHIIWHLDIGGGEVFLRGLTAALARRGLVQHVFTVGPSGRLAPEVTAVGVPVTSFGKSSWAGLRTIGRMARALGRLQPSIVHTHGEAGLFWGIPAARLASVPIVSLIYQNHEESAIKTRAARAALRFATRVVAGSSDVARFAHERFGVPEARLRTIYCGIATEAFAGCRRRRTRADGPVCLTVGRLIERKGHRTLIDAFGLVRHRVPGARLVIAGDGPERAALARYATDGGIAPAVLFPGTVYPTVDLLADADVFVFPSLIEPQGLALVEAYAAGVPVVASRTGGIPEMLEDEVDGLLVEPGDPRSLAAGMLRMIEDPAFGEACAGRARRRLAAFDVDAIADEYVDLYRAVVHA